MTIGRSMAWLQDHPLWTSLILAVLVALHGVVASLFVRSLNPYKAFDFSGNAGTAVTLYLGAAAAAAIVAGFASVVIVFTIGATSPRLRLFRKLAGEPLRGTWLVVVAEPLAATFLGILASVTQMTSGKNVAPWMFELAVVLLVHGSYRLIWILRELISIVNADDELESAKKKEVKLDKIFPSKETASKESRDRS